MAVPAQAVPIPPDEDAGPSIMGVTIGMTLLGSVAAMALRLYVRIRMSRNFGWDDYMMCIAALLSLIGMVILMLEVQNGGGRHRQYIEPDVFSKGMYLNFLSQPFYLFAALFVKESVGFFLLRITGRGRFRTLIVSIMVFLAVYTVACLITLVLQCKDMRVIWNPTVKTTCWRIEILHGLSYTNSVINITTDFAFAVLIPTPLIYPLQMSVRKKLSLLLILSIGLVATCAAIVRAAHLPAYGRFGDFLWDSRGLTTWYVVETQIGIIAGSLPCAKPLLARCWVGGGGGDLLSKLYGEGSSSACSGANGGGGGGGGGGGVKRLRMGSDEIGLMQFDGGKGGTVAVVTGGGGGGGGEASFESSRTAGGRESDDDDGISIGRIDREIGGRGMSISGPDALGGGIVRTTNVRVDYGSRVSMV